MKILFFLLIPGFLFAQAAGNWEGQVSGEAGSLKSTMQLTVNGSLLSGTLNLLQNQVTESYVMEGTIQGNQAKGTLAFNGQKAMTFELQIASGRADLGIFVYNQKLFKGEFSKVTASNSNRSVPDPGSGLKRDPALTGKWYRETTWAGGSNTEYFLFNADGTMDGYTTAMVAAYSRNASGNSIDQGSKMPEMEKLKALGARWYSHNQKFCVRFMTDGKVTDQCTSRYSFIDGVLKLTDLSTGKVLYYRKTR